MSLPVRWSLVPSVDSSPNEPVLPETMRGVLQLSPDDDSQDEHIATCLSGARRLLEGKYRVLMRQRSVSVVFDAAPCARVLRLPVGPLVSVTSFTCYKVDDAAHTLVEGTDFEIDTLSLPGRVLLKQGVSWPSNLREANALVLVVVAGWTSQTLPEVIVPALQQTAAFLFEHRGEGGAEFALPPIVDELMADYYRPEA